MNNKSYVYILASKKNGTLYTGVTSDLKKRILEHKHGFYKGFTYKYNISRLVWFVEGNDMQEAINLEKKIKNRPRQWKVKLIEKDNPEWLDLAEGWYGV